MLAWDAYQNREELGKDLVGKGDLATTGDPLKQGYDRDHPTDTLNRFRRKQAEKMRVVRSSAKIEAPELIRAYTDAKNAVAMAGKFNAGSGPGSVGKSSPRRRRAERRLLVR